MLSICVDFVWVFNGIFLSLCFGLRVGMPHTPTSKSLGECPYAPFIPRYAVIKNE